MPERSVEHWRCVEQLFERALAVPTMDRDRFLADASTDGDEHVVADVRRMLAQHETDPHFMETPAPERFAAALGARGDDQPGDSRGIPAMIGQYRPIRLVGEGGMGLVYEAEQLNPRRRVALKVIRPGVVSPSTLKRFEQETHILGQLQHPAIAHVFEAGSATLQGAIQPYFAMELVEGDPITTFVRERSLPTTARLELFARVCDAVAHAHEKGVVHRDLKPANILVTRNSGAPKVLDFGVARLTREDGETDVTMHTSESSLIGTLPYMSPEQLSGKNGVIDKQSDVYALGVIGYEIIADTRPHALEDTTLPEAIRIKAEREPTPLSRVDRAFRGDLETVFTAALRTDKSRRYTDAGALASDIRRLLRHEPIAARNAGTLYRVRKLVRRHRTPVIAAALLLVVATGAAIGIVAQANHAAEQERRRNAVNELVSEILPLVDDPDLGTDPAVYADLMRADGLVADAFADDPLGEAQVRSSLGDALYRIGRAPEAERQFRRMYELNRPLLGPDDPATLSARSALASCALSGSRFQEAADILRDVIPARERVLGPVHEKTLASRHDYIRALQALGEDETAERAYRDLLDTQREHLGHDDRDTLVTAMNLASLYSSQRRYAESEHLMRDSVDAYLRRYGEQNGDACKAMGALAVCLRRQNKHEEAREWYERYVNGFFRLFGDDHSGTVIARYNYGTFLWDVDEYDQAIEVFLAAAAGVQSSAVNDRSLAASVHDRTADLLKRRDRHSEALPHAVLAYEHMSAARGRDHDRTASALERVIEICDELGDDRAAMYRAELEAIRDG